MVNLSDLFKYEHPEGTCYANAIQTDGTQVKIEFQHPVTKEFVSKWVDENELVKIGNNVPKINRNKFFKN